MKVLALASMSSDMLLVRKCHKNEGADSLWELPLVPIRVKILSMLPNDERTAGTKLPV